MVKFRTRARTVDMLGRQQIANVSTAISELFKNAHDAAKTNVQLWVKRASGALQSRFWAVKCSF